MSLFAGPQSDLIVISAYVLCFAALNTISFLLALFYNRKLKQSSPHWGFIIAVLFSFAFIAFLLAGRDGSESFRTLARFAITVSVLASVFSTVSLIVTMQRVRK